MAFRRSYGIPKEAMAFRRRVRVSCFYPRHLKKRRAAQNPNFPLEVIDRMADSLGTDWRDIAALFRGTIITIIPDGETGADEA